MRPFLTNFLFIIWPLFIYSLNLLIINGFMAEITKYELQSLVYEICINFNIGRNYFVSKLYIFVIYVFKTFLNGIT